MTRVLVLGFCSLSSFGFLLALVVLVPGSLGHPIQLPYAMAASIIVAPWLAWRLTKGASNILRACFHDGEDRVARLPGPAMGLTVQRLAALGPADLSVLVMALRHEGDDEVFVGTAAGSANHELWGVLTHLGLMGEIKSEPELARAFERSTKKFYITPNGRKLIPSLIAAAGVIRTSIPELAEGFDAGPEATTSLIAGR